MKKISDVIRQKLEQRGLRNLRQSSQFLGISPELLRVTLNKGHVPKDKILKSIAEKLGLDPSTLILTAHQEKVPTDVKGFFLSPSEKKLYRKKRTWPISEEQTEYLKAVMNPVEIQVIRKIRQLTDEARSQMLGYLDYLFDTRKQSRPASALEISE